MNYPLKDFARFFEHDGRRDGLLVTCPNCGMSGSAWFKDPIGGGLPRGGVLWDRTGETLESLSLNPSFRFIGHFHSWIKNGELQVDSPFTCQKIPKELIVDPPDPAK